MLEKTDKTDRMLLVEERANKDVREVLSELMAEANGMAGIPPLLEVRYGVKVPLPNLYGWVKHLGGEIRKSHVIEWAEEAVAA